MFDATNAKLEELASAEGFAEPMDLLEAYAVDSLVPAICMNDGCSYILELEPDQRRGWCDACATNSMQSALVIAGVI